MAPMPMLQIRNLPAPSAHLRLAPSPDAVPAVSLAAIRSQC